MGLSCGFWENGWFSSPSGKNKAGTGLTRLSLQSVSADSSTEILKTLVGILLGLAVLLGGWIIFSAEGFYSPMLFLTGTIMIPLGVLLLGTSLTGGLGESPPSMLARVRQRGRKRERAALGLEP